MVDCMMAGTVFVGLALVWLLLKWCQRQVEVEE